MTRRYRDCGDRAEECIEFLREDMQIRYEDEDYQNVVSFLDQVAELISEENNEVLLTSAAKKTLKDQARYIATYRGYTGAGSPIRDDDITNLAQLTSVIMRYPISTHLRPPFMDD